MGFYSNKNVLITGASSGIGEALAFEMARRGAIPLLVARREDRLKTIVEKIRSSGCKAEAFVADVSRPGDLEAIHTTLQKRHIFVDVIIANAGFGVAGNFSQLKNEDYQRQFDTNIFGVMNTVRTFLSDLTIQRGNVAVIGSVLGYVALPGNSAYGMSKFALRAFCDCLYHELRPKGIKVTQIAPGFVQTDIRKVNNFGKFKSGEKDPIPNWIQMSSPRAAKKIATAIARGCPVRILTIHGWIATVLGKHFSGLLRMAIQLFSLKGRKAVDA